MKWPLPPLRLRKLANRYSIGAVAALSMQIAGAALSFLVSLLIAKVLGVAGLGLYFLSVTNIDICATVSRLGLENATLKFVSVAHASAGRDMVATVYRRCLGIAALSAAAMILPAAGILIWAPIGASHHDQFATLVPLLMIALIPVAVLPVQTEALKAVGFPGTSIFAQTVFPQSALLLSVMVLAWQGTATIASIMTAYAGVFLLATLLAFVRWKRIVGTVRQKPDFSTALLLRTSLPMLVVTSLNLVMAWTDTMVLGILSTPEQLGVYGVALRISATVAFILIAINSVVAPQFAGLHSSGRHAELEILARRSSFWTLVGATPLILIFIMFPTQILGLLGEQFEAAAWPLRLLALAQLVNVSTGQLTSLLIMTGHEKLMRNNMIFSAALNFAGNLALVPLFGALGAAVATTVSISVMKLIAWRIARHKLQINTVNYFGRYSTK